MADTGTSWDCEAYGPEAREIGALCFFTSVGRRACTSPAVCHTAMMEERRLVYGRIVEQAAAGDKVARWLLGQFSGPDEILNGGRDA